MVIATSNKFAPSIASPSGGAGQGAGKGSDLAARSAPANKPLSAQALIHDVVGELAKRQAFDEVESRRRRVQKRYALGRPVPYSPNYVPGQPFRPTSESWGVDMSEQGIGLIVEGPLEPASPIYVDMAVFGRPHAIVEVRVLYCRRMVGNMFRIGAVFIG